MTTQTKDLQPVLFVGHGSPMIALETRRDNPYVGALQDLGAKLSRPKAILVISAHWRSHGTRVVADVKPKIIYDFGGFPKPLYEVQYPAPGQPDIAARVMQLLPEAALTADGEWGLDHGAWTVLLHMFPDASIPVLQLSINKRMRLDEHLALAEKLRVLREEGVLIMGSGNIVHNLGELNWQDPTGGFDWANAFDQATAKALESRDVETLLSAKPGSKAHPTLEHYIPLLYAFGASTPQDKISYPVVGMSMGGLSMRSVLWTP